MKSKQWSLLFLVLTVATLGLLAGLTAVIDPFFHYHAPLKALSYPLDWDSQRYLNDGVIRNFDYDAMITGTSMTEYFKSSECDTLFGVNSIKVPFSGASFTELNNNIRQAIKHNPHLKFVFCSIDDGRLYQEPGYMRYDCPDYLYDDSLLNDVQYLLNKEVLCSSTILVLRYTRSGAEPGTFDDYHSDWGDVSGAPGYSKADILSRYSRVPIADTPQILTEQLRQRVTDNLTDNTVALARENPDIQFYYFYPPYSLLYWDQLDRSGTLERELETFRLTSQILTGIENIHLFSFYTDFETITDFSNYHDPLHFSTDINTLILSRMARGEYELTPENYEAHWQAVADFYRSYGYDEIYKEEA
ncbi:MAG: hypothetical protein Q4F17_06270 [Eubacteriales bacterium]|nr:hypothetical protein [Eubacteriales bacterium]